MADDPAAISIDEVPTREALVARARAMIPTLRARSKYCEELRYIPPETVEEFRQAGFFRIGKSPLFGGYGLGIEAITEVAVEIGRGCGSSSWMAGQWPGHQFMVGYFTREAQEEYWAGGPDTLSSTAGSIARINIETQGDGYRIRDSQWRFSSGCDYAEWIHLFHPHGVGLVPKADFEVLDDWYVSGLRGTGSKSIVIKDAYIPPHRLVTWEQVRDGTTPGAGLIDDPYLREPLNVVLNQLLLASNIGMASGVLDLFEERVTKRTDLHTGKPASESPGAQLRFAESHAEVEAAKMFMLRNCATLVDWGRRRHVPDMVERAALRRDVTYASKLAVTSTQRLMSQGDASGMFDNNQIGRLGRDCYMAGLQASLTFDEPAQAFSRTRWGVTPISLMT